MAVGKIKGGCVNEVMTNGFAPILGDAPRVLVLGTLPSQMSLRKQQYYGHPQNGFWKIMAALLGANGDYAERCAAVTGAGIAIWDVLHESHRPGSMDADIDIVASKPNPIVELVNDSGSIELICFNGQKARQLFDRLIDASAMRGDVRLWSLPSTSPAYASMPLAEKTRRWAEALSTAITINTQINAQKD